MTTEQVSGYTTRDGKRVPTYKRVAKPKKHSGVHKGFERDFHETYYQDDEGRIVKIKVKPMKR